VERVRFAKSWREFFGGVGLESFGDFYDYPGGTRINKNNRRSVYRLTFGKDPETKIFYIKRFEKPHFKDILGARRNFGRFISQADVEWSNANLLEQNGIDAYKPVCMGEQTICGLERKSFFMTEQLKSTCLLDFVIKKWHTLERKIQNRIIIAAAQLVRKAHRANISLRDLYIWHLFIDEGSLENDCRLSVIDLHRMLRDVKNPNKKIIDMGALYWSMSSDYFDDEHKDLLVATYTRDGQADKKEKILAKIRNRAKVLDSRRTLRHHYEKANPHSSQL